MAKCKNCKDCKFEVDCILSDSEREKLKICLIFEEKTPITNAMKIRSMTDEELAEFLDDIAYYCKGRQNETYCSNCRFYFLGECNCVSIGEWLKSEVGCE